MKVSFRADDNNKHELDINHLLFYKGKLYTAGDDGRIKAWDLNLKFVAEVQAHPCSVFCLAAIEDTLFSCSNEGTVKAWELDTLKEKGTLFSDSSTEVWRIGVCNGYLVAGDCNGNVRVFKDGKIYGQLNVCEPVKDMLIDEDTMFTVKDLDVTITDLRIKGEKLQFGVKGTLTGKSPIALSGSEYVIFVDRDGKSILIHENSSESKYKKILEVKDAHELIINALTGAKWDDANLMFSGGWDKKVKKWKIEGDHAKPDGECDVGLVINCMTTGEKNQIYVAGGDGHLVRVDLA